MGLVKEELLIVSIEELLRLSLSVPVYQRPYRWTIDSTNTLFMDIYENFKQGIKEYRLGSVILHKKDNKYHIVDGQQRLTTMSILLYRLGMEESKLPELKLSNLSQDAIIKNDEIIQKKVSLLQDERPGYKRYLLKQCAVVQIVTDEEQEAFQFFDSQNSRGKELEPHDLLKSYHLREMNTEDEKLKTGIINRWENKDEKDLKKLFEMYLYPLSQWCRKKDGMDYSSRKIPVFKGIKIKNIYNYAIYQKASNLFVEQSNSNGSMELLASKKLNQFQLTQPLIAGKRFFEYTLHYADLLEKIQEKISGFHGGKRQIPETGTGDIYIKQLYECALLFFADRFSLEAVTDLIMQQLYTWCYSLRLVMHSVYVQTINKYALGNHDRINNQMDLFAKMSEMIEPEELNLVVFEKFEEIDKKYDGNYPKYQEVRKFIREANRWEND